MNYTSPAQRVVITGLGCISAAGRNYQEVWAAIKNGKSGIAPIQQWDTTGWEYTLGGEIKQYDPRELIADRKLLKLISKQDVVGLNAATQALEDSRLLNYRESLSDQTEFNDRTGVFVGSPGNRFEQQYDFLPLLTYAQGDMQKFATGLFEQIHPMWLLRILPNNVLAYIGIQNNFKGANENVANHVASGPQAIALAYRAIKEGIVDRAIAVAYECAVEPEAQVYYGSLGVLSTRGLRPFDRAHDGTILADGAGALVLESLASAKLRGAKIYGEVLGDATTSEADGLFSIRKDADGLIRALELALNNAKVDANDIGMVSAHGNGTVPSDATEALAFTHCFGENTVPVTSFKWALGHTLGAAGILETIFTLLALQEEVVPGIASLQQKAADCARLKVQATHQTPRSPIALLVARGFASINSCLVVSSFQG